MNNFIFENATKVYFGRGCVREYLRCKVKPYSTVMLAYGGGSIKANGIYGEVMEILRDAGKQVVEFSGIMANPTYQNVLEGAQLAQEKRRASPKWSRCPWASSLRRPEPAVSATEAQ